LQDIVDSQNNNDVEVRSNEADNIPLILND